LARRSTFGPQPVIGDEGLVLIVRANVASGWSLDAWDTSTGRESFKLAGAGGWAAGDVLTFEVTGFAMPQVRPITMTAPPTTLDVTSKTGAGRYALEVSPTRWHGVLEAAIALRADRQAHVPAPPDVLWRDALDLSAWLIEDAHRLIEAPR
jgi:hypothetical protein